MQMIHMKYLALFVFLYQQQNNLKMSSAAYFIGILKVKPHLIILSAVAQSVEL